jgi:hypothetical protein
VLFLYEASREDTKRVFTLDEIAHGIHMAPNTMRVPPIDQGLLNFGVILRTRHVRAPSTHYSGLIPFLQKTFAEQETPFEPLVPLLFYNTIKRRAKKTDHWLQAWLEQYQEQDLQKIRADYQL